MHYNDEDKLLIKTFTHAMRDIEHLYLQAIQSNNKELARKYAQQAQAIVEELKTHYQDWSLTSTADEYYAGFKEVEKMKRGVKQHKIRLGRDAIMLELGTIHTDAMEALANRSHLAVFATLDGVKNNIIYGISMFNETKADMILQHQIQSRLGAGILTGKSVQTQKSELISFFKEKGFHLKDRNGRKRDPSTYAEMLIRTERARAYNTGTLNRGIELGITRYRVDESSNCCSICAKYNGKIVDITKGNYELPPYHPNCRGTIEPVFENSIHIEKIGEGEFGAIYEGLKDKEAEQFLITQKSGEMQGAYSYQGQPIDLFWGDYNRETKKGVGLSKIIAKHPEALGNIQNWINTLPVLSETDNRIKLSDGKKWIVISKQWRNQEKRWILTAYEIQ